MEKGGGGGLSVREGLWRWGEREIRYLSLHCHHQNDSCIKMGSDESSFNVSLPVSVSLSCFASAKVLFP